MKTVGDDCVPTEHETFTGNVNPKRDHGMERFWTGLPGGQPTLAPDNAEFMAQDANTFTLAGPATLFAKPINQKFTRTTKPS